MFEGWDWTQRAAISRLLAPFPLERFAAECYERKPVHISGRSPFANAGFLSLDDVEQVLFGVELPPRAVRISKNGSEPRSESFTRTVRRIDAATGEPNALTIVDPYRATGLFAQGASIIFDDIRPYAYGLAAQVAALEGFFRHKILASVFLTPSGCQGFACHYDVIDAFVLQIEGRKRWRLYEPHIELPVEEHLKAKKSHTPGASILEVELQPGDVLYLPRGTYHEAASSSEEYSLHVTLGLAASRWADVFAEAIRKAAMEHAELRRSIAASLTAEEVRSIVQAAFDEGNLHAAAAEMASNFAASHRNDLHGQLRQVLDAPALSEGSVVALRDGALYELTEEEDAAVLAIFGTRIRLPKAAIAIVSDLQAGPRSLAALGRHGSETPGIVRRLVVLALLEHRMRPAAIAVS